MGKQVKGWVPPEDAIDTTTIEKDNSAQESQTQEWTPPQDAIVTNNPVKKKDQEGLSVSSSGSEEAGAPSGKNTTSIQLSDEQKEILAKAVVPKTPQQEQFEEFQKREAKQFITKENPELFKIPIVEDLVKTIHSGLTDQLPKEYYAQRLRMSKGEFGDLYDKRSDINAFGGDEFAKNLPKGTSINDFQEWNLKQKGEISGKPLNERAKIFLTEKLGAKGFTQLQDKFKVKNVEQRIGFEKNIEEQNLEASQKLEGTIQGLQDVHGATDFLNFAGNMIGQALYRAPTTIIGGPIGSIIAESSAVYDRQLDLIAEKKGISRKEVIKQGLDKPAEGQALAVLAGTLDAASEFNLVGMFKKAAGKELTESVVKKFAKGFVRGAAPEAVTEVAQGELEEIGAAKGAGTEYHPDGWRMATSAVGGAIGGGVIGASSKINLSPEQNAQATPDLVKEQTEDLTSTDTPSIEHAADVIDTKVQQADEATVAAESPVTEATQDSKVITDQLPTTSNLEDNAIQERSTKEILQRQQEGPGVQRSERGGVESGQQGESITGESVGQEEPVPADNQGQEEIQNEGEKQQGVDLKGDGEKLSSLEEQYKKLRDENKGESTEELENLLSEIRALRESQKVPTEAIFKLPIDENKFGDGNYRSPQIEEEVDVNLIAPSQKTINKDYVKNPDEKYIPSVNKVGDKYIVNDGHHRIAEAINSGAKKVKANVRYTNEQEYKDKVSNKTSSESRKKTLLNRAYEGTTDEQVKSSIEKHGLNYEVESHASAEKAASNFINDVGVENAVEAVRKNSVDDGAAAFIWAKAIDDIGEKLSQAKTPEQVKELTDLQTGLIDEFDKKARSGGRFISALQEVYRSSDFGYKTDYQIKKYKEANNGKISPEIEAKFTELGKQLKEANDKIKALEESSSKTLSKDSFQNIRQDLQAQKEKRIKAAKAKKEKIDNFFDSLKVKNDPNKLNSITQVIGEAVWNGSIEVMRKAVLAGADVATAIQAGIDYINEHYHGNDFNEEEFRNMVQPGIEKLIPTEEEGKIKSPSIRNGKLIIPNSLIRQIVESGVNDINELTENLHSIIKETLPDVTLREVRDTITKYGETRTLSQDEINVKIREMKRVGKLISALEDVQNKLRPLRSGLQRDKLTDQERRMQREIKEAMKDLPVDQEEVDKAWKNSLDSVKSRLSNQIADLEDQIKTGVKTPKKKGIEYDAEANALKDRRDELKKILAETEGKQSLSDEQKTRNAIGAVQRTIDEYERRIKEKDFEPKQKAKTHETAELKSLRDTRDKLKVTYKQLEQDLGVADKKKLANYKKSIQKSIGRYEDRIKNKDFAPPVKKKPVDLDKEASALKLERDKIKAQFDVEQEKVRLANRPWNERYWDTIVDVWNIPKSLLASIDMSAPFRQGALLSFSNPKAGAKSFAEMFRQAFSEKKASEWLLKLKESPEYDLMKQSKLYLAESNTALTAKEEQFLSNFAGKIPVVGKLIKGSERAYTGYLNKLRADVFINGADRLMEQGITPSSNPEAYKAWASFINNATGRGNLGALENAATVLNGFFFSPRYLASRINLLNPVTYAKMPKEVRMMALKNVIAYVGLGVLILSLAAAAGADVEHDPRSSDFGKIKIGNTRYDIWAGFAQVMRFIAQLTTGERKSTTTGEIIKIDGKEFPFENRGDVAAKFARTKLSPTAGTVVNLMTGKDLLGNDVTIEGEVVKNLIPLYLQDIASIYKAEGPTGLTSTMIPAFFGIGVQNYEAKKKKKKQRDDGLGFTY